MKLRQLIAYKNALQQYNVVDIRTDANMELQRIMHEVDLSGFDFSSGLALEQDIDCINSAFDSAKRNLDQLKHQVAQEIQVLESDAYADSLLCYQQSAANDTVSLLLTRRTHVSTHTSDIISNRIKYHSDWRYPGMIFSPLASSALDTMVSLDPLYLIDTKQEFLNSAIEKFEEQYQNRLCCCVVDEHNQLLSAVPDSQIGVCVAVDFFNFRPLPIIQNYFEEIVKKLRPGGTLCMTINDCDHVAAMILVEKGFSYYTPGSAVIDAADAVGLDLSYQYRKDGEPVTWVEFRKPGSLTSLRGGQTLAKIVPKTLAES
jgi:hypothetical protein